MFLEEFQIKYYKQMLILEQIILICLIASIFIINTLNFGPDFIFFAEIIFPLLPPINAFIFFILVYLLFSIYGIIIARKIASVINEDGTISVVKRKKTLGKILIEKIFGEEH